MSGRHRPRRPPVRLRSGGRALTLVLLFCCLVGAIAPPAMATWSLTGAGSGRSGAAAVNAGAAPVTSVSGPTVTLTWSVSTLSNGAAVTGYLVKRYDAAGSVAQTILSGSCAAVVAGTTCSETNVPAGSWTYSITPLLANWRGAESTKAAAVVTPPPAPSISSGPGVATAATGATFVFTDSQAGVTYQCSLDGAAFGVCTSPTTYSGLAQGGHTFAVRAVDSAGNQSTAASYNWTVDSVPPTVAVTFPVAGTTYSAAGFTAGCGTAGAGDVCGTASDAATGVFSVRVSLRQGAGNYWNGTAFASATEVLLTPVGTTSWSYAIATAALTPDGAYTTRAVVTDTAGNTATTSATATIDTTAPAAPTITAFPTNPTAATTASFSFTGEAGATFECQLDGGGYSTCTSPKAYSGLATGSHTFAVRAVDTVGNTGSAATYTWTISSACLSPGVQPTLTATRDAYIDFNLSTQNFGLNPALLIKSQGGSKDQRTLVGFTLPVLPSGCSVTAATLSLYNQTPTSGRIIDLYAAAAAWTETGVTWATQPAISGTAVSSTTVATAGFQSWTVTAQVKNQYSPGPNNGFLLRDQSEQGAAVSQSYRSREAGATPPQLVITIG